MNKKSTVFIQNTKQHIKQSVIGTIRTQVQQTVESSAPAPVAADTSVGSSSTSTTINSTASALTPINNTLPEAQTYYTTDGVTLYDDTGARWGQIIDQIPVGDNDTKTDIQINAVLSRQNDSLFTTPSRAQYLIYVWFDNIKAEPANHYIFYPYDLVTTVAAQAAQVVITALYVNVKETI